MTDRPGANGAANDAANAEGETTMSTDSTTEAGTGASTRDPSDDEWRSVDRLRTTLNYAVLGGLLLLAAISAVQLYLAVGRTISTFVVYEYRAPLLVAFNLAVLLLAALGVSLQLRRLSGSEEE
jgi:hypothetical protein